MLIYTLITEYFKGGTAIARYSTDYRGVRIYETRRKPYNILKPIEEFIHADLQYHETSKEYAQGVETGIEWADIYCADGYFAPTAKDIDHIIRFIDMIKK